MLNYVIKTYKEIHIMLRFEQNSFHSIQRIFFTKIQNVRKRSEFFLNYSLSIKTRDSFDGRPHFQISRVRPLNDADTQRLLGNQF